MGAAPLTRGASDRWELSVPKPRRRARPWLFAVVAATVVALAACTPAPDTEPTASPVHSLVFPVQGNAVYVDSFGQPRPGGRVHQGQDLMAPKLRPVLAATDGTITWLRYDNASVSGNLLVVTAPDRWTTTYIHLNNDTPGTDDGLATIDQVFPVGIVKGATVKAGQVISWVGDSGDAEAGSPHLHFELRNPNGVLVNPYPSLRAATIVK